MSRSSNRFVPPPGQRFEQQDRKSLATADPMFEEGRRPLFVDSDRRRNNLTCGMVPLTMSSHG
jgi:hypothetical protein